MGRHSCCPKQKLRKGLWSPEEDEKLCNYITRFGVGCWSSVPQQAGLQRCGKSCRLRWINYLRPDLKRGMFSQEEEDLIVNLHKALGNRWAQISAQLPGRTDNEIKNFWNSYLKKKLIKQGIDPATHKPVCEEKEEEEEEVRAEKNSPQLFSSSPLPSTITIAKAEQPFPAPNYSAFMNHGRPIFDTTVDFHPVLDPILGYNPSLMMTTQFHQSYSPDGRVPFEPASQGGSIPQFDFPSLANPDSGSENLAEADFSDNSVTVPCPVLFDEAKESSSSSSTNINGSGIFWDTANNRMESLYQYNHEMNGVKVEGDQEPVPWEEDQMYEQNLDDFSYMFQQIWKV